MDWRQQLLQSNREPKPRFGDFSEAETQDILRMVKTAAQKKPEKTEAPLSKTAFYSEALDVYSKTKNLIRRHLGVTEDAAHELTSSVLGKAEVIHNRHGEDFDNIVGHIVLNMAEMMNNDSSIRGTNGISVQDMQPSSHNQLADLITMRLKKEFNLPKFSADRMALAVLKEAGDFTVAFRPARKEQIANALLDLAKEHNDTHVILSVKTSDLLKKELEGILKGMGGVPQ